LKSIDRNRLDGANLGGLSLGVFTARLLLVILILAIVAAAWRMTDILLLLFGAALLAIGLRAAAQSVA
jgi:hypothetical protein